MFRESPLEARRWCPSTGGRSRSVENRTCCWEFLRLESESAREGAREGRVGLTLARDGIEFNDGLLRTGGGPCGECDPDDTLSSPGGEWAGFSKEWSSFDIMGAKEISPFPRRIFLWRF